MGNQKKSQLYEFGLDNREKKVPVESFSEDRIGHAQRKGKLIMWPEQTGGISESSRRQIEQFRPTEEEALKNL